MFSWRTIFLLDVSVLTITILGILLFLCGSKETLIFFLDLLWQQSSYSSPYFLICSADLTLFLEMIKAMDSLTFLPINSSFLPTRLMLLRQLRSRSKISSFLQCYSNSARKQLQKFQREWRKSYVLSLLFSSPSRSRTNLLSSVLNLKLSLLLPHFFIASESSPLDHYPSHPRQMTALSSQISRLRYEQMCAKWKVLAYLRRNSRQRRWTFMFGSSAILRDVVCQKEGQWVRNIAIETVMNQVKKDCYFFEGFFRGQGKRFEGLQTSYLLFQPIILSPLDLCHHDLNPLAIRTRLLPFRLCLPGPSDLMRIFDPLDDYFSKAKHRYQFYSTTNYHKKWVCVNDHFQVGLACHIFPLIIFDKMIEEKPEVAEQTLARMRMEKRNNRRHNMAKNFRLDISPEKYKGMHFLGNFKDKNNKSTLSDPRVHVLPQDLIVNRTVLDLGAGDASTTIQIAMRLFPKQIVALDIDGQLLLQGKVRIDRIIGNNERYKAISENQEIQKTLLEFPLYFQEEAKRLIEHKDLRRQKFLEIVPENLKIQNEFPKNICFLNDNFFNIDPSFKYDTIVCFGTVKWVHLALGDKGVEAFFHKAYDVLKPDGYFVLEYSLKPSYQKKKGMNEIYRQNFRDNIKIDPQSFPELLRFVGFQLVQSLHESKKSGLKHLLQIFKKASLQASQED